MLCHGRRSRHPRRPDGEVGHGIVQPSATNPPHPFLGCFGEVCFGQLVERYQVKRVRARDLWHLCSRLARKVLSHTVALLLNQHMGNSPRQLAQLLI